MRARLLRGVTAAVLAIAVVVPGASTPAQANPDGTNQSLINTIDLALTLLGRVSGGGVTEAAMIAMTQDVINALNQAESAVIAHIDSIAVADLRSKARHAVLEFEDINSFTEDTLQDWAQSVSGAALQASDLIATVNGKAAADSLGYAAITLYGIALVARIRAEFGTTRLMADYRVALQRVIDRLAPTCNYHFPEPRSVPLIRGYTCEVYGPHVAGQLEQAGLTGGWQLGPIVPAQVEAASYARTSRQVAIEILAGLQ